MEHDIRH